MSFGATASVGFSNNAGQNVGFTAQAFKPALAKSKPAEDVIILIYPCQICVLEIPHGTPRAKEIREYCKQECFIGSPPTQLWYFRGDQNSLNLPNKWTNVADANAPALSAPPYAACAQTKNVLAHCSAVRQLDSAAEQGADPRARAVRARVRGQTRGRGEAPPARG